MKVFENNEIFVRGFDGTELRLSFNWDADMGIWIEQFKTILYWTGFDPKAIQEEFVNEE